MKCVNANCNVELRHIGTGFVGKYAVSSFKCKECDEESLIITRQK